MVIHFLNSHEYPALVYGSLWILDVSSTPKIKPHSFSNKVTNGVRSKMLDIINAVIYSSSQINTIVIGNNVFLFKILNTPL